ncbi:MAG: GNAT family N-acetyltransferase [Pyrinomonadaceae bacterium]
MRNETPAFECRFLDQGSFDILLEKFGEAFSDYSLPPELDPPKFRNHINLNAIDLARSVGCFEGDELIGFSLNGFGKWNGKETVYDAGTGVVPSRRRRGASTAMFDFMVPILKDAGIEQVLLEVITDNVPAVNLYKNLGFVAQRELMFMEAPAALGSSTRPNNDIEVRRLSAAEIEPYSVMWQAEPSWQNSHEAVCRSEQLKTILAAFVESTCAGYIVYSKGVGRIAQFVVDTNFRGRGVGSRLLAEMERELTPGSKMQVINLDTRLSGTVEFFQNRGFQPVLSQYEMIMPL